MCKIMDIFVCYFTSISHAPECVRSISLYTHLNLEKPTGQLRFIEPYTSRHRISAKFLSEYLKNVVKPLRIQGLEKYLLTQSMTIAFMRTMK